MPPKGRQDQNTIKTVLGKNFGGEAFRHLKKNCSVGVDLIFFYMC